MNLAAPLPPAPEIDVLEIWTRDPAELSRLARFDPVTYCRTTLARTDAVEVVLIGWLPGQSTPVHGHGDSEGIIRVIEGLLEEVRFAGAAGVGGTRGLVGPGDLIREAHGTVHQVRNPSPERAVSLHVYSPPLPPARISSAAATAP